MRPFSSSTRGQLEREEVPLKEENKHFAMNCDAMTAQKH